MPYEYKRTEHMVQIAGHNKVVNTGGKKILIFIARSTVHKWKI